jgi:hypothetical protein
MIAIKPINPNFWFPGSNKEPAVNSNKTFKCIKFKKATRDILCNLGILPSQTLAIIVFKKTPNTNVLISMKSNGYKVINIPKNPYLE